MNATEPDVRRISRAEPSVTPTNVVLAAFTTAWLIFIAPAHQALGFAAYFVGWGFGVGVVPWPGTSAAYGVLAALYIIFSFGGFFAEKMSGSPLARVGRELFALVALPLCLIGPPLVGYSHAAFGTTFLTAQLPVQARKTTNSLRGIIISYGGAGDPRYTVLPLNMSTHLVDANSFWFVDRGNAMVEELRTGRVRPRTR